MTWTAHPHPFFLVFHILVIVLGISVISLLILDYLKHHPYRFLTKDQQIEVKEKIAAIEQETHSKIVIHVLSSHAGDLRSRAVKEFSKHELFHKEIKTGILLLISLKSRQFQILGDEHIHQKLGEKGWSDLSDKLSGNFREGKFFEGIRFLLDDLEEHLKTHFSKTKGTPQLEVRDEK
jgi:uncharacterized membrane protein